MNRAGVSTRSISFHWHEDATFVIGPNAALIAALILGDLLLVIVHPADVFGNFCFIG